ncbi:hypothetical protein DVH05_018538 [Phytophthora capsici]|nr:hypothetical protein DVH05_018538 [Phytophthora capsici]
MECKSALKMRWSAPEAAMLAEEWAKVCVDPLTSQLRGEDLNKVLFDRFNIRCVQSRQPRRSPQAVLTQRDRMFYFARFVVNFDSKQLVQGRSSWFQLSSNQRREIEMPSEWRRQAAIFSPETLNTFQRVIIPHLRGKKSKNGKKWSSKGKKTPQKVVKSQPAWSMEEKVRLVQRWGDFIKKKELPLEEFEAMTYNDSCKSLASLKPRRSPFAAWRKARTLVVAWRFITAFNKKHQPGWFELMEEERDSKIKWEDLPDKFEDIEPQVFLAMNKAVPNDPTPSVAPFGPSLLLTDSSTSSEQLDRFLLEDNVASSGSLKPNGCAVETPSGQRPIGPATASSQPLEPFSMFPSETIADGLQVAQETHSQVLQAAGQLQEALDDGNKHTIESIRALKPNLLSPGQLSHLELVLDQHKNRMISVLRLAEETSRQHDAEIRSLTQNVLGNDPRNDSAVVFV